MAFAACAGLHSVGNAGEAQEELLVFLSNLQCAGAHPRPVPFTREGAELFTAIPVPRNNNKVSPGLLVAFTSNLCRSPSCSKLCLSL